MSIIYYICECRCRVPVDKIKSYRDRTGERDTTRLVCPYHYKDNAYIAKYVCKCADCEAEFVSEKRRERCPKCHTENHARLTREAQSRYQKTEKGKMAHRSASNKYQGKTKKEKPRKCGDGWVEYVNCKFFGPDKPCGNICTAGHFGCNMMK